MDILFKHKQNIEAYEAQLKDLKNNAYQSLLSYINEITEGHTEGVLYPMGKGNTMTLPSSYFKLEHLYYNKKDNTYEVHIDNCTNRTPLSNYPVNDLVAIYKQIFYIDTKSLF